MRTGLRESIEPSGADGGNIGARPGVEPCSGGLEFAEFTRIRPNSTNSRPFEHGSTPGRAPTLPLSAPDGSMDSLSPSRIYGTSS